MPAAAEEDGAGDGACHKEKVGPERRERGGGSSAIEYHERPSLSPAVPRGVPPVHREINPNPALTCVSNGSPSCSADEVTSNTTLASSSALALAALSRGFALRKTKQNHQTPVPGIGPGASPGSSLSRALLSGPLAFVSPSWCSDDQVGTWLS